MARTFNGNAANWLSHAATPVTDFPFTWCCWFKAAGAGFKVLMSICNSGSTSARNALIIDGTFARVNIFINNLGTTGGFGVTGTFTADVWNFCAATFASSTDRAIWLNTTKTTDTNTAAFGAGANRIGIGQFSDSTPSSPMTGDIAETAIYTDVLTDDEILSLAAGFAPPMVRPDLLAAYYPLRDADGDADWWGQYNLTLNGSLTYSQHPPIIYPSGVKYFIPASGGGGGGTAKNLLLLGVG